MLGGSLGQVKSGPQTVPCELVAGTSHSTWWEIEFENGERGWVVEDFLKRIPQIASALSLNHPEFIGELFSFEARGTPEATTRSTSPSRRYRGTTETADHRSFRPRRVYSHLLHGHEAEAGVNRVGRMIDSTP